MSLEAVARAAGVGIGTLYRHFPSREALIEAVYRNEVARLCARADDLLAGGPPDMAMRRWMDAFGDYVTTKWGMADALRSIIASGAITPSETRDLMMGAIGRLLDAGGTDGVLRADVSAGDVFAALTGVFLACGAPDQRQRAERILDLLMDGLRATSAPRPTPTELLRPSSAR